MYYDKFEKLCKENGVNPRTVSLATGIAPATLSNWKKGNYTPKTDKLQKICDFFNVPLEYLTGSSDNAKKPVSMDVYDVLSKVYNKGDNNKVKYPIYLVDSRGRKKLLKLVDINADDMPTITNEDDNSKKIDTFFVSLSDEQKEEITRLYHLYQNASPEVRSAVELLLKAQSQEL